MAFQSLVFALRANGAHRIRMQFTHGSGTWTMFLIPRPGLTSRVVVLVSSKRQDIRIAIVMGGSLAPYARIVHETHPTKSKFLESVILEAAGTAAEDREHCRDRRHEPGVRTDPSRLRRGRRRRVRPDLRRPRATAAATLHPGLIRPALGRYDPRRARPGRTRRGGSSRRKAAVKNSGRITPSSSRAGARRREARAARKWGSTT